MTTTATYADLEWKDLRSLARANGIKAGRTPRAQIEAQLKKKGVEIPDEIKPFTQEMQQAAQGKRLHHAPPTAAMKGECRPVAYTRDCMHVIDERGIKLCSVYRAGVLNGKTIELPMIDNAYAIAEALTKGMTDAKDSRNDG